MNEKTGGRTVLFLGALVLALGVWVASYFWPDAPSRAGRDLAGQWLLTLPAGFEHTVRLEALGSDRYRLDRLVFAGVYEVEDDRLVVVEPADRRLHGFAWQITDRETLTLVAQPDQGKTGANYLGATLKRRPP